MKPAIKVLAMTRLCGSTIVTLALLLANLVQGAGTGPSIAFQAESDTLLYTIENSTSGVVISIASLCSDQLCSPSHTLLMKDVFLSDECSMVPCNDHQLVVKTQLSPSKTQYITAVPSNESVLLLRFHYHLKSGVFELNETARVSKGILNCSPTSFLFVNGAYYILCVNSSNNRFMVYNIDSIDDFQEVSFNPVLDDFATLTLPISDISSVSSIASKYIVFVGGSEVFIVNIDDSIFYSTYFDECTEDIYKLSLRNTSEHDALVPYLLYCNYNYAVVDIIYEDSEPIEYDYNATGYPVVCRDFDTVFAEFTMFSNSTLAYNGRNFSIPGHQILLQTSFCFAVGESLMYVYSDRVLGVVMISIQDGSFKLLFSEVCTWSPCGFRVVDDRYVFLIEEFNDTYIVLRLYDALERNFVSNFILNYEASLAQLIILPQSPSNLLAIVLSVVGTVVLLVLACVLLVVLAICIKKNRRYPAPADDDNDDPQPQEETSPLLDPNSQAYVVYPNPPTFRPVRRPSNPLSTVSTSPVSIPPRTPPSSSVSTSSSPPPPVSSEPNNNLSSFVSGVDLPLPSAPHNDS